MPILRCLPQVCPARITNLLTAWSCEAGVPVSRRMTGHRTE
jgi:hypothetical protein